MKIAQTLKATSKMVAKHSPLLLTIGGVIGLGATAVLSYKAAKKVEVIVEDLEYQRGVEEEVLNLQSMLAGVDPDSEDAVAIRSDLQVVETSIVPSTRFDIVRDIAGAVALPVVTGVASIAAISLSYYIQNNRIVGLATALATAQAERVYYKNKYATQHGQAEADQFFVPTDKEEVVTVNKKGKEETSEAEVKRVMADNNGCWFDQSSEYTSDDHDYNMAFINSINERVGLQLFKNGFVQMNQLRDELGLPRTRQGALLGWSTGSGLSLYPRVTMCLNKITGELEPQIYINWTAPTYIYENVEYDMVQGAI